MLQYKPWFTGANAAKSFKEILGWEETGGLALETEGFGCTEVAVSCSAEKSCCFYWWWWLK